MAVSRLGLLLCTAVVGVLAGSKAFQPRLEAPTMQSLRSNATQLQKRWIGIATSSNDADYHLWPDKTITYAFEDSSNADIFIMFLEAMALWWDSSLPTDYQYKPSDDGCKSDRFNCLLVKVNTAKKWETTVALPPKGIEDSYEGPVMDVDIRDLTSEGLPKPVVLVAHELGHAWGLLHEHQNPVFWSKTYNPNSGFDGTVFSEKNFHCTNLPDYYTTLAKVRAKKGQGSDDETLICTDWRVANNYEFSARWYLPEIGFRVVGGENMQKRNAGPDDVDWASIMIYPTTAELIITRPDGTDIVQPEAPSNLDVIGITTMYGHGHAGPAGKLLNEPGNPSQAKFNAIVCAE